MKHLQHPQRLGLLFVVVSLLLSSTSLAGQGPLRVRLLQQKKQLVSGFQLRDIVDPALRKRLHSGLTNHIVIDAQLKPEGFGQGPIFKVRRTFSVVYDLWEDSYIVKALGAGPKIARRFAKLQALETWLSNEHLVVLGEKNKCKKNQSYHVELRITVNPVSQKVLRRSREMISGSPDNAGGQNRSLFGSVARIFFNISADHDVRVIKARSSALPLNAIPSLR